MSSRRCRGDAGRRGAQVEQVRLAGADRPSRRQRANRCDGRSAVKPDAIGSEKYAAPDDVTRARSRRPVELVARMRGSVRLSICAQRAQVPFVSEINGTAYFGPGDFAALDPRAASAAISRACG